MPTVLLTRMSTVPVPGGAVAVMLVALSTVKPVAAETPKFTPVVPMKFVPVMVTAVPPACGPAVGAMLVIVGVAR